MIHCKLLMVSVFCLWNISLLWLKWLVQRSLIDRMKSIRIKKECLFLSNQ